MNTSKSHDGAITTEVTMKSLKVGDIISTATEGNVLVLGKYSVPRFTGYLLLIVAPADPKLLLRSTNNTPSLTGLLVPMNTSIGVDWQDIIHHTVTDVAGYGTYSFEEKLDKIHTSLKLQYDNKLVKSMATRTLQ